jgi:hypothetical protein
MFTATPLDNAPFMEEYFHNSLAVDSDEMRRIQAAVKENRTFCVLGFSERHQGSLYISQVREIPIYRYLDFTELTGWIR